MTTKVTEPEPEPEVTTTEVTTTEATTEATTIEVTTVETEPEPEPEPEPEVTTVYIPEETEPTEITEELVDIPDEEVPLTDIPDEEVPKTGDTYMWFAMSAFSGIGLVALNFFDKKKKENE